MTIFLHLQIPSELKTRYTGVIATSEMLRVIQTRLSSRCGLRFRSSPPLVRPRRLNFSNYGCVRAWIPAGSQNGVEFSGSRNGFRAYNASSDLAAKKCVPCSAKDLRPMNEEVANDMITKVPGWTVVNEDGKLKIRQTWKVKSFTKGLEFFRLVADIAEAEGHHPDLHLVGWNNVTIQIWTHAVGGLTENDFILAAKINGLDLAPLLRRKPVN